MLKFGRRITFFDFFLYCFIIQSFRCSSFIIPFFDKNYMNITDWVGVIGVSILLIAFLLNLMNKISSNGILYISLNFIGAAIACLASILLNYIPFIVLEAVWTFVSLFSLIKKLIRK